MNAPQRRSPACALAPLLAKLASHTHDAFHDRDHWSYIHANATRAGKRAARARTLAKLLDL